MLADFLKALREGIQREARPQLLENVSNEHSAVYAMPNGEILREDVPSPLRRFTINSFSDIVEMLVPGKLEKPIVFHDTKKIVVLLDREDRREWATMALPFSGVFARLHGLQGGWSAPVPQLVRFLRALKVDAELLASFRRIDFTRTTQGRSDVQRGRESLGRSVEAHVQQADKIPESFNVHAPVYGTLGLQGETYVSVPVEVYIDHEGQKIELSVDSDEIELAIDRAHAAIRSLLPPAVECYRGSPA